MEIKECQTLDKKTSMVKFSIQIRMLIWVKILVLVKLLKASMYHRQETIMIFSPLLSIIMESKNHQTNRIQK